MRSWSRSCPSSPCLPCSNLGLCARAGTLSFAVLSSELCVLNMRDRRRSSSSYVRRRDGACWIWALGAGTVSNATRKRFSVLRSRLALWLWTGGSCASSCVGRAVGSFGHSQRNDFSPKTLNVKLREVTLQSYWKSTSKNYNPSFNGIYKITMFKDQSFFCFLLDHFSQRKFFIPKFMKIRCFLGIFTTFGSVLLNQVGHIWLNS